MAGLDLLWRRAGPEVRVVVLGGTRFIGRAIVDDLLAGGHELLIVHRGQTEPDGLPPAPHLHVGRSDLVSHAGELRTFDPEAFVDCRALTRSDARSALDALPNGIRLVVLSSGDVYRAYSALLAGTVTDAVPLFEDSPVRTERYQYRGRREEVGEDLDHYEKLDVEKEYLVRGATVCRLPMVYGEHDYQRREEFILRRIRAGRLRIPVGPGTWLTCRGYVGEVARGVRLALESSQAAGEVFNLAEAASCSIGLLAQKILKAAGSDAELVPVPDDALPDDLRVTRTIPQHLFMDSSKAREMLGWVHLDPEECVGRTVAWHLANPPEDWDRDFSADDRALAGAASDGE